VQAWDRDEPEQAGALRVEVLEAGPGSAQLAARHAAARP
jgi:hypothetical protein